MEALNKYWPNHPHFPKNVSDTLHEISDEVSNVVDKTPALKNISNEIKSVEPAIESKFSSLRKLYNTYVESWFYNPVSDSSNYSIFTDWKTYLSVIIIIGIMWYFFGESISSKFRNSSPFNPIKKDDDFGRPGPSSTGLDANIQQPEPFGSGFKQKFYNLYHDFISNLPFVKKQKTHTSRDDRELQASDFPSTPVEQPLELEEVSVIARGKMSSVVNYLFRRPDDSIVINRPRRELFSVGEYEGSDIESNFDSQAVTTSVNYTQEYDSIRAEYNHSLSNDSSVHVWDEIYQQKGEKLLTDLINNFDVNNNVSDYDSVSISDTPALSSDNSSDTDVSELDSVFDVWGND
uniref:hypothetical protein n=1 Tax=Dichomitus squalens TaxID=114155 RepID=UPI00300226B1|nr:hypothetical protein [Dichomitus squalens]